MLTRRSEGRDQHISAVSSNHASKIGQIPAWIMDFQYKVKNTIFSCERSLRHGQITYRCASAFDIDSTITMIGLCLHPLYQWPWQHTLKVSVPEKVALCLLHPVASLLDLHCQLCYPSIRVRQLGERKVWLKMTHPSKKNKPTRSWPFPTEISIPVRIQSTEKVRIRKIWGLVSFL